MAFGGEFDEKFCYIYWFIFKIVIQYRLTWASITIIDALFYNNFPILFIISFLYSIKECTYRFRVTVGFLWPRISESVFTSIPHSNARVAKVCRKEWKPRCWMFSFLSNVEKLRWYDLIEIRFEPFDTICVERLFFFTPRKRGINCFGIGIVLIDDCVFGVSVIRPNTPFSSLP